MNDSNQQHILLIENNSSYKTSVVELSQQKGLDVHHYDNIHTAPIIQDAVLLCGLALIDQRAEYDDIPLDNTGLTYALKLHKSGRDSVLMTAAPESAQHIFLHLRHGDLAGVINKTNIQIEIITECIIHYFKFRRFPNGIARYWEIRDDNHSEYDNINETYKETPSILPDFWISIGKNLRKYNAQRWQEIEVLLRALIPPCATLVVLKKNKVQGQSGSIVLHAWIKIADGPVTEELAIKLGARRTIKSEILRYDRFVGPLPDGAAAQLRWRSETDNLAAIAYSWVGDSVEEGVQFSSLVKGNSDLAGWHRRRNAVNRLFSTAIHRWCTVYRSEETKILSKEMQSLSIYYFGKGGPWYNGMTVDKLRNDLSNNMVLSNITQTNYNWCFNEDKIIIKNLPDPVAWLNWDKNKIKLNRLMPCHGDLHVGNIFVLPDDSPRLIDFGRTDLGHVFRDFAALEASIRLTCVGIPKIEDLQRVEIILAQSKELSDWIDYESLGANDDIIPLREALHLTLLIRRAALDACGMHPPKDSMREYIFALIIHLLKYATGVADECPDEKKKRKSNKIMERRLRRIWHAHYAAAMAVECLKEPQSKGNGVV